MSSLETTSVQTDLTISQAKELQRVMEGTLLKMERLGLLEEAAADHIRIIVAEGIAEKFGEKYRSYPSAPRLDSVGIRRDILIASCVLPTLKDFKQQQGRQNGEKKNKRVNNKQDQQREGRTQSSSQQPVQQAQRKFKQDVTQQNQQSLPEKTVETSSTTKRVSDWVEDVADADLPPTSFSPEKASSTASLEKATSSFSLAQATSSASLERFVGNESRQVANASRWEAILNNPIQVASPATREAYANSTFKGSSVSLEKCSDSVAADDSANRKMSAVVQESIASEKMISGNTKTSVATKKTSLNRYQAHVEDDFAFTDMDVSPAIKEDIVPAKIPVVQQVPVKNTPVVLANNTPFVKMQDTEFHTIFSAAARPRTPASREDAKVNSEKLIDFSP